MSRWDDLDLQKGVRKSWFFVPFFMFFTAHDGFCHFRKNRFVQSVYMKSQKCSKVCHSASAFLHVFAPFFAPFLGGPFGTPGGPCFHPLFDPFLRVSKMGHFTFSLQTTLVSICVLSNNTFLWFWGKPKRRRFMSSFFMFWWYKTVK